LERIRPSREKHESLCDTAVRLASESALLHHSLDRVDAGRKKHIAGTKRSQHARNLQIEARAEGRTHAAPGARKASEMSAEYREKADGEVRTIDEGPGADSGCASAEEWDQ
jgi:hypothetical protein